MKTLMIGATLALTLAGGAAYAAAPITMDKCDQWNLKPGDLSACHAQWNAAKTDEERSFVIRKYDPNAMSINAAQDARDSLGSGAKRNTGATGTTHINPPEANEILPAPNDRASIISPAPSAPSPSP